MDWITILLDAINGTGFPIVCCILEGAYIWHQNQKMVDSMNKNTEALTKLMTLFEHEEIQ